ncbi:hypothetical protein [Terriglobus albidus]|uniref:hypothetical protein n=1 Tax=Terriglobus albidus TaxID=1592106 RepID=UPI0021DFDFAE|nr:hypothetical protein [Terriglobus albidus]
MKSLDEILNNFETSHAELTKARAQEKEARERKLDRFEWALQSLQTNIANAVKGRTAGGHGFATNPPPNWYVSLNYLALKITSHDAGNAIARVAVESTIRQPAASSTKSIFLTYDGDQWDFQDHEYPGPLPSGEMANVLIEHFLTCYLEIQSQRPLS